MDKSSNKNNRQENDQEYISLMKKYIQDKYSITVDVVEHIFPQDGINTALKENILVVKDSNGVIANIRARLSTPYNFYDDYVESCTAANIQAEIDLSFFDNAKIYVVVNNANIEMIDTSPSNIDYLTFVSTVTGKPEDDILKDLYEVYDYLCQKGYENIGFLVGFTDGSSEFGKAVENYMIYGKSDWDSYSGEVYAELYVTDQGLSFEEFKERVN